MKVNLRDNTYSLRSNGFQHGDVFTHPRVVSFMLDMVGYTSDKDLSGISIMEPSCGEGEFLVEIVKRLYESSLLFGFDVNAAYQKNVYAVEIDGNKVAVCAKRIKEACHLILNPQEKIVVEDFLTTNSFGVDIA